jgi:hypothetical protein
MIIVAGFSGVAATDLVFFQRMGFDTPVQCSSTRQSSGPS